MPNFQKSNQFDIFVTRGSLLTVCGGLSILLITSSIVSYNPVHSYLVFSALHKFPRASCIPCLRTIHFFNLRYIGRNGLYIHFDNRRKPSTNNIYIARLFLHRQHVHYHMPLTIVRPIPFPLILILAFRTILALLSQEH